MCRSDSEGIYESDLKTRLANQGRRTSSGDGRRQANVRRFGPTLGGEGRSTESSLNRPGSSGAAEKEKEKEKEKKKRERRGMCANLRVR